MTPSSITPAAHPSIDQTTHTYARMAREARYRPTAPSDGMGTITAAPEDLNLQREAANYATGWRREEDTGTYMIGCPGYSDRPALIYMVEEARNLCGMNRTVAARLLRMALTDLETDR
jgi:hypothetical protein